MCSISFKIVQTWFPEQRIPLDFLQIPEKKPYPQSVCVGLLTISTETSVSHYLHFIIYLPLSQMALGVLLSPPNGVHRQC